MRRGLILPLLCAGAFLLVPPVSPAFADDTPDVSRTSDLNNDPGVKVEHDQKKPGDKRDHNFQGVVETEKSSGGTTTTTALRQLTSDTSLDEFVSIVCDNPDQYFADPTYIPACGDLTTTTPTDDVANRTIAEDYVRHYLQIVGLDKPRPTISAQNGGICGVMHSLNLNMRMERLFEDDAAPFGTFNIHAYAKATVDWGDGSKGTYATSGGPYPNMSIAHSWTTRGSYDINVNSAWSASWSMGPYSGVLTGIPATGSINDFPVYEAQAMLIK